MKSYRVVLLAEEDGRYSAFVPALPGALSWGDTVEEALANVTEASEELPVERPRTVVTSVGVRVAEPIAS